MAAVKPLDRPEPLESSRAGRSPRSATGSGIGASSARPKPDRAARLGCVSGQIARASGRLFCVVVVVEL
jgi:hypothetical protein